MGVLLLIFVVGTTGTAKSTINGLPLGAPVLSIRIIERVLEHQPTLNCPISLLSDCLKEKNWEW